jgi:hypothetical protein
MELTPQPPLRTFTYTSSKKLAPARALPGESTVLKNEKKISHDPSDPNTNLNQPNTNSDWQTYRTRFTIRARILSAPLSFVDALGRDQNGKRGDYLVESNGMVTITPRHIFEDVYVEMDPGLAESRPPKASGPPRKSPISTPKRPFFPASRRRSG